MMKMQDLGLLQTFSCRRTAALDIGVDDTELWLREPPSAPFNHLTSNISTLTPLKSGRADLFPANLARALQQFEGVVDPASAQSE